MFFKGHIYSFVTGRKEILENDAEYDAEATSMNFAVLQVKGS